MIDFDKNLFDKNNIQILATNNIKNISNIIQQNYPELYNYVNKIDSRTGKFTEKLYIFLNGRSTCETCNSTNLFFIGFNKGFSRCCSIKCSANSADNKQKHLQKLYSKYDVSSEEDYKIKLRELKNKYARDRRAKLPKTKKPKKILSSFEKLLKIERARNTCNAKYGVDNPSKTEAVKKQIKDFWENISDNDLQQIINKRKETNLKIYGTKSTLQHSSTLKKIENTKIKKYGSIDAANKASGVKIGKQRREKFYKEIISNFDSASPVFSIDEYNGVKHHTYKFKCHTCNNEFVSSIDNGFSPRCTYCFPKFPKTTEPEIKIREFLIENGIKFDSSRTDIISPKELDIYIPSANLAIEYCGLYWHSELLRPFDYHSKKYLDCAKKNIQLLTIFHDVWYEKQELVKNLILYLCNKNTAQQFNIDDCNIKNISETEFNIFNNQYQIDTFYENCEYNRYGLFYNNLLISTISCINNQFENSAKILNITIHPKFSIDIITTYWISYLVDTLHLIKLSIYSNHLYDNGNIYKNLGFREIDNKIYFTYTDNKFVSRFSISDIANKKLLNKNTLNLNNKKLHKETKYYKVFDCGVSTYYKDIK